MPTNSTVSDPHTILLAEDDSMVRNLVKSLLTSDGHQVIEARDGVEALEISRSYTGHIDLLVTDIRMPRMNGPELARQIQTERPGITILVMSAFSGGEAERISLTAHFIGKPFNAKKLTQKVHEILESPLGGLSGS